MKHVLAGLAVIVTLSLLPDNAAAQAGFCYICDDGCTGALYGASQCAQPAPGECDLYGAACSPQFALTQIDAAGTISSPPTPVGLEEPSGSTHLRRECDNAIVARSYTNEEKAAILEQALAIDL